ncbi:hypothetical protein KUV50_16160 [Membranicola marinus]|uniref:MtN3 and saliva related transmembrane protein n=1 Tax=Membranihabitans marinus TaxID=1227546 RepID=A0A953HR14_9BACT|nr:hypothetical protein [Membranihabitans marinus]MBY5959689.1 hypothetical protein [Membranihabitans marinus]
MNYLDSIPAALFEFVGIIAGLTACFVILIQLIKEYKSSAPSSLSNTFLIGWLFIYAFWGLYGVRFDTMALWLTNAIAVSLQAMLCVIVFRKKARHSRKG